MDTLIVRCYNVLFGDATLVSIPEKVSGEVTMRHILIDLGNVRGKGAGRELFKKVEKDVRETTGGQPLDLFVMTHEHMDHVKGPLFLESAGDPLRAEYAWLTASSAPDYYETHEEAQQQRRRALEFMASIEKHFAASGTPPRAVQALLANNNFGRIKDCVDYVRSIAPADQVTYAHREVDLGQSHPFREATLKIWAPEESTADYYGRFRPLFVKAGGSIAPGKLGDIVPPPGVDAGAFFDLLESRSGYVENLLAIDRATNNTSLVFSIEWRGWRLLFSGDAEIRSWRTMNREGMLKPVHFLKVSHHGSANGTPPPQILDKILPADPPDSRPRHAVVSTCENVYRGVPDGDTLKALEKRCEVIKTDSVEPGSYVEFSFPS